jgi:hypothetical protein
VVKLFNTTNYCWKTAGTKVFLDRPPWETVRLYQLCVASHKWESINYLWDWALLLVFVRWPKCQVQPTALGRLGKAQLEISWWKLGVMKNLKRQNWSVDWDLSKTALKKRQFDKNRTVWEISSGCSDQLARLLQLKLHHWACDFFHFILHHLSSWPNKKIYWI